MKIHAFARYQHFMDHIAPIWNHLPESMRGWKHLDESRQPMPPKSEPDDVVMVAGDADWFIDRRLIYVEHGAGQRYRTESLINPRARTSYHGCELPKNVIACISPRRDVADSWSVPAFAAGAPICDPYDLFAEEGVVAITFHWNAASVCPEATNAFDHYYRDLGRLIVQWRRDGLEILGHHHPRFSRIADRWKAWKVPVVDADTVRRRASILIADNTSLAYEMAYLGRQVVTLNAPWFRRDVDHGLRFWSHVPGVQVDNAKELEALDLAHLVGGWNPAVTEYTYGKPQNYGDDGIKAAAWVTHLVTGL